MIVFVSVFVSILLVELALYACGRVWFHQQIATIIEVLGCFFEVQNDEHKQRLILSAALTTFQLCFALIICLVFFAALVFFVPWVFQWDSNQQSIYILALSIEGIIWFYIRSKYQQMRVQPPTAQLKTTTVLQNNYNTIERLLHLLALGSVIVRRMSFNFERILVLPSARNIKKHQLAEGPVYICGLARSGTTALLRVLNQSIALRSLSYRDMPFVLAPNLWRFLTRFSTKKMTPTERAHKDGIIVDYDSPEAFEEVFWRTFHHSLTKKDAQLPPTQETMIAFAHYRALVANPNRGRSWQHNKPLRRYLSKNNNNLLRLKQLSLDPTATILLMYRCPIDTARSLYSQHQRFTDAYEEDYFPKMYMNWLGHHEFGPGHEPFYFAKPYMTPHLSPEDPNYWLDYWNAVYRYILLQEELGFYLIEYELLCDMPKQVLSKLTSILGLKADLSAFAQMIKPLALDKDKKPIEFDNLILQRAQQTLCELQTSKNNLVIKREFHDGQ